MIINQMKNMCNDRQNFIRGIIDISHEYLIDLKNYDSIDNYWVDRENLINRSFGDDISSEIEVLLSTHQRLINQYNKNEYWFKLQAYYLDSNSIIWLEKNDINYVAIKSIENEYYYDIYVKYENDRLLYDLIFKEEPIKLWNNTYTIEYLRDINNILTKANWHCINNPICDSDVTLFNDYMVENGEQYIDWLDSLAIGYHDIWPQKIESNTKNPMLYFRCKEHINLYKSIFVELKMLQP